MKKWYLLTLWFGDVPLKCDTVEAINPSKALANKPYSWSEFIGEPPLGQVTVHGIDFLPLQKDLIVNAVSAATIDS